MSASKVIIDTDPGVDDAMAIAFALAHPKIDLLALTTVFGNVSVRQATTNALALLDAFGAAHVPVAAGAAVPVTQEPLPHPDFVHGADGLGNIDLPPSSRTAVDLDAASYLVAEANRIPGEITVVAIGPLTNIRAAMQLDEAFPQKLKSLVIMGGAVDEPGNVSPLAEANFLGDAQAADDVLGAEWPATVVGLDVTHQIMLFDSDLDRLEQGGGATGGILRRASRFYIDYYSSTGAAVGLPEPGCAMHDAAALALLVEPGLFKCISGPARVVTEGIALGQLAINRKGYTYLLPHWENRPATSACMEVQAAEVKALFLDSLLA